MDQVALCLCGCGQETVSVSGWITGHWNRGKHHENRKPQKPDSKETRQRKSESQRKKWEKWHLEHPQKSLNLCACGCGVMVKGKWKWGHHSRVQNISKRDDIREKRRKHFIEMHAEGKLGEPWSRGLTKEDDVRLMALGKSISATILANPEERGRRAIKMKEQWFEGNIIPLRGPDHPNWKGGTSALTSRMRASHQLYERWKRPILVRDGFKCKRCGRGGELEVHHDQERFASILQKCLLGLFPDALDREITFDEGSRVLDAVVSYHVQNQVSGLALCEGCHEKVHSAP